MSEKRNLTVSLDKKTIRQAKVLAAKQGTSISRLVAQLVRELVERERTYEASMSAALAHLESGYHLGGEPPVSREALHDH